MHNPLIPGSFDPTRDIAAIERAYDFYRKIQNDRRLAERADRQDAAIAALVTAVQDLHRLIVLHLADVPMSDITKAQYKKLAKELQER
ncbi:hypothetical protein M0R72_06660 [Candidatus Pacearchaeota archaeon]|jgi:hypothetical protein|nr:hypothetical protein [Candidatus Pacearchaeota archaeon]